MQVWVAFTSDDFDFPFNCGFDKGGFPFCQHPILTPQWGYWVVANRKISPILSRSSEQLFPLQKRKELFRSWWGGWFFSDLSLIWGRAAKALNFFQIEFPIRGLKEPDFVVPIHIVSQISQSNRRPAKKSFGVIFVATSSPWCRRPVNPYKTDFAVSLVFTPAWNT